MYLVVLLVRLNMPFCSSTLYPKLTHLRKEKNRLDMCQTSLPLIFFGCVIKVSNMSTV